MKAKVEDLLVAAAVSAVVVHREAGSWKRPKPVPKTASESGHPRGQQSSNSTVSSKPLPRPIEKPLAKPIAKPLPARPEKPIPAAATSAASLVGRPKPPVRTISAGGYYFEADDLDRTVRAYGQLRLQLDQPRSRSAQDNAGKPDRKPKDHGGHFIARQFGGPEISYNHFAQNARFNNSDYRKLENSWKRQLNAGRKFRVDIGVSYSAGSRRPDVLNVTYYVDGKRYFEPFTNSGKGK